MRRELQMESSAGVSIGGFRTRQKILALSVSFFITGLLVVLPIIL